MNKKPEENELLDFGDSCDTRISNDALRKLAQKEEPRLLSILLKDKDCLMDAMSFGLKSGKMGHFWTKESRFLFLIIEEYYKKHKALLTRTAMDSIMESLDKVGNQDIDDDDRTAVRMYWDKVYHTESSSEDYELLRDHINNRYIQWQAYEILKKSLDSVVKSTTSQDEIVKKIRDAFFKIDNIDADPYCLTMGLEEGMIKALEHIKTRREHPEEAPAVFCGIQSLDDVLHGFSYGSYTIISGMINGGKTTLMFNMAFNMARAGYHVVYVSIEKEAVPFYTRLLSLHALIDYNRIQIGGKGDRGLNDYYYSKYQEAATDLIDNIKPNFECIQVAPGTKISKILSEVEKIKAVKKIDALFIDYLGVIGFETNHASRPDLDEAIVSKTAQAYGKINRIATFAATQLKTPSVKEIRNKAQKTTAENNDASKIQVNTEDLAGSKMIPADADNVLGAVLNGDSPATKMYINITKARDAQSRILVPLDFDGRLGRVSDPEFEPGQIKDVDKLVYDKSITTAQLDSEDGLFAMSDDKTNSSAESDETIEVNEEDFSFLEKDTDNNADNSENTDNSNDDEDIYG